MLGRYAEQKLKVAVEAGGQTGWIYDVLRELGARVHVVHPLKVKWIAESKKKTDRVDAALLAQLLRIGGLPEPVHMPSRRSRELRQLPVSPALREVLAGYAPVVAAASTALKDLDRELEGWAARDARVTRLQTIPGVGRVSAQTLVAVVDRIERFPSAKKLVAYSGKKTAIVALARKLLTIAFHLLRQGTAYDPQRLCRRPRPAMT